MEVPGLFTKMEGLFNETVSLIQTERSIFSLSKDFSNTFQPTAGVLAFAADDFESSAMTQNHLRLLESATTR
jgi:hypothetical protein